MGYGWPVPRRISPEGFAWWNACHLVNFTLNLLTWNLVHTAPDDLKLSWHRNSFGLAWCWHVANWNLMRTSLTTLGSSPLSRMTTDQWIHINAHCTKHQPGREFYRQRAILQTSSCTLTSNLPKTQILCTGSEEAWDCSVRTTTDSSLCEADLDSLRNYICSPENPGSVPTWKVQTNLSRLEPFVVA